MEGVFITPRKVTVDRYVLMTTKETKKESIKHFYRKLKDLSVNSELGNQCNQTDTLIRDLFIANKQTLKFSDASKRDS